MGRLTIDIPDETHHHLKVLAANRGVTIREYVLERIGPELDAIAKSEPSLRDLAGAWEEKRKEFKLERGERSVREILHDGHKW